MVFRARRKKLHKSETFSKIRWTRNQWFCPNGFQYLEFKPENPQMKKFSGPIFSTKKNKFYFFHKIKNTYTGVQHIQRWAKKTVRARRTVYLKISNFVKMYGQPQARYCRLDQIWRRHPPGPLCQIGSNIPDILCKAPKSLRIDVISLLGRVISRDIWRIWVHLT